MALSARACGARRCTIASSTMVGGQLRSPVSFYLFGQRPHGVPGDLGALAPVDCGFGNIDGGKDFRTAAFALHPKRQCRVHRILRAGEPAALDSSPHEIPLLRGQINLHTFRLASRSKRSRDDLPRPAPGPHRKDLMPGPPPLIVTSTSGDAAG